MLSMRKFRIFTFVFIILGVFVCPRSHAQAALLMEEPYGIFGVLNPTGHNAIYFQRICAETPVTLRRCQPGEMGVVIARYQGIDGYDWVAIPLVPYLYAVENAADVPAHVDRDTVTRLRNHYREAHLRAWAISVAGQLFARRLDSTGGRSLRAAHLCLPLPDHRRTGRCPHPSVERASQSHPFQSALQQLRGLCSRELLNHYFPRTFRRSIFPDAGMTTPKQTTYRLVRYARKHPEVQLTVFEIPQVPGYRHESHSAKGIDESLVTTVYAIPIAILNPYLAGGLFADYLVRGRYHLIPRHPQVLSPGTLSAVDSSRCAQDNSAGAETATDTLSTVKSGPGADAGAPAETQSAGESNNSLQGIMAQAMSKSQPQSFKNHATVRSAVPFLSDLCIRRQRHRVHRLRCFTISASIPHGWWCCPWRRLLRCSRCAFIRSRCKTASSGLKSGYACKRWLPRSGTRRSTASAKISSSALRFAADDEVVELAKQALEHNLTRKQIKERIKDWRGDYWRV